MGFYTDTDRVGQRLRTAFTSSTTPSVDTVDEIIDEVENEIDSIAGRSYRKQTIANELHDYSGVGFVVVKKPGLQSVSLVEYTADDGATWTTVSADDYYVYPDNDFVQFKNSIGIPSGFRNVRISYVSGPSVAPLRITKLATAMACLEVIRTQVYSSGNSSGGEVQVGPIRVTEPGMFSVSLVRDLKADTESLLSRLSQARIVTTVAKRWDF